MIRKLVMVILVISATIIFLNTAQAALIFDFTGSGGYQNSYSFTFGGVTVTAVGTASSSGVQVYQDDKGLGVKIPNEDTDPSGHPKQTDGYGEVETLTLSFDNLMMINSAYFTRIGPTSSPGGGDHFSLLVDGNTLITSALIPGGAANDGGQGSYNFSSLPYNGRTGTVFKFTVPSSTDDYTLKNLNMDIVPEPATLSLLGLGLVGLLGLGYKKKVV